MTLLIKVANTGNVYCDFVTHYTFELERNTSRLKGECFAGNDCPFEHDMSAFVEKVSTSLAHADIADVPKKPINTVHEFPTLPGVAASRTASPSHSNYYWKTNKKLMNSVKVQSLVDRYPWVGRERIHFMWTRATGNWMRWYRDWIATTRVHQTLSRRKRRAAAAW